MSNEQKLREALQALLASGGVIAEAADDELQAAIDDPDAEEIVKVQAAAVLNARQALATTEPVMANGLTEAETDASASVVGLATTDPAVNQQLTTEPVDDREARATLPTQRSSVDGLPKPFGYVSDGFADGLRFQHNPWPVEHTLLHSTMPVFSAAAVQQFKQDAERYRWLASSESVAMNAKSKDHQSAISDAWTTLEKLDADKALIDAAIDAAMAEGVKG